MQTNLFKIYSPKSYPNWVYKPYTKEFHDNEPSMILNENTPISIHENEFEQVACKTDAVLSGLNISNNIIFSRIIKAVTSSKIIFNEGTSPYSSLASLIVHKKRVVHAESGLSLGMSSANEIRRYILALFLIGRTHTPFRAPSPTSRGSDRVMCNFRRNGVAVGKVGWGWGLCVGVGGISFVCHHCS